MHYTTISQPHLRLTLSDIILFYIAPHSPQLPPAVAAISRHPPPIFVPRLDTLQIVQISLLFESCLTFADHIHYIFSRFISHLDLPPILLSHIIQYAITTTSFNFSKIPIPSHQCPHSHYSQQYAPLLNHHHQITDQYPRNGTENERDDLRIVQEILGNSKTLYKHRVYDNMHVFDDRWYNSFNKLLVSTILNILVMQQTTQLSTATIYFNDAHIKPKHSDLQLDIDLNLNKSPQNLLNHTNNNDFLQLRVLLEIISTVAVTSYCYIDILKSVNNSTYIRYYVLYNQYKALFNKYMSQILYNPPTEGIQEEHPDYHHFHPGKDQCAIHQEGSNDVDQDQKSPLRFEVGDDLNPFSSENAHFTDSNCYSTDKPRKPLETDVLQFQLSTHQPSQCFDDIYTYVDNIIHQATTVIPKTESDSVNSDNLQIPPNYMQQQSQIPNKSTTTLVSHTISPLASDSTRNIDNNNHPHIPQTKQATSSPIPTQIPSVQPLFRHIAAHNSHQINPSMLSSPTLPTPDTDLSTLLQLLDLPPIATPPTHITSPKALPFYSLLSHDTLISPISAMPTNYITSQLLTLASSFTYTPLLLPCTSPIIFIAAHYCNLLSFPIIPINHIVHTDMYDLIIPSPQTDAAYMVQNNDTKPLQNGPEHQTNGNSIEKSSIHDDKNDIFKFAQVFPGHYSTNSNMHPAVDPQAVQLTLGLLYKLWQRYLIKTHPKLIFPPLPISLIINISQSIHFTTQLPQKLPSPQISPQYYRTIRAISSIYGASGCFFNTPHGFGSNVPNLLSFGPNTLSEIRKKSNNFQELYLNYFVLYYLLYLHHQKNITLSSPSVTLLVSPHIIHNMYTDYIMEVNTPSFSSKRSKSSGNPNFNVSYYVNSQINSELAAKNHIKKIMDDLLQNAQYHAPDDQQRLQIIINVIAGVKSLQLFCPQPQLDAINTPELDSTRGKIDDLLNEVAINAEQIQSGSHFGNHNRFHVPGVVTRNYLKSKQFVDLKQFLIKTETYGQFPPNNPSFSHIPGNNIHFPEKFQHNEVKPHGIIDVLSHPLQFLSNLILTPQDTTSTSFNNYLSHRTYHSMSIDKHYIINNAIFHYFTCSLQNHINLHKSIQSTHFQSNSAQKMHNLTNIHAINLTLRQIASFNKKISNRVSLFNGIAMLDAYDGNTMYSGISAENPVESSNNDENEVDEQTPSIKHNEQLPLLHCYVTLLPTSHPFISALHICFVHTYSCVMCPFHTDQNQRDYQGQEYSIPCVTLYQYHHNINLINIQYTLIHILLTLSKLFFVSHQKSAFSSQYNPLYHFLTSYQDIMNDRHPKDGDTPSELDKNGGRTCHLDDDVVDKLAFTFTVTNQLLGVMTPTASDNNIPHHYSQQPTQQSQQIKAPLPPSILLSLLTLHVHYYCFFINLYAQYLALHYTYPQLFLPFTTHLLHPNKVQNSTNTSISNRDAGEILLTGPQNSQLISESNKHDYISSNPKSSLYLQNLAQNSNFTDSNQPIHRHSNRIPFTFPFSLSFSPGLLIIHLENFVDDTLEDDEEDNNNDDQGDDEPSTESSPNLGLKHQKQSYDQISSHQQSNHIDLDIGNNNSSQCSSDLNTSVSHNSSSHVQPSDPMISYILGNSLCYTLLYPQYSLPTTVDEYNQYLQQQMNQKQQSENLQKKSPSIRNNSGFSNTASNSGSIAVKGYKILTILQKYFLHQQQLKLLSSIQSTANPKIPIMMFKSQYPRKFSNIYFTYDLNTKFKATLLSLFQQFLLFHHEGGRDLNQNQLMGLIDPSNPPNGQDSTQSNPQQNYQQSQNYPIPLSKL